MHLPGYIQEGQEASYGYLLLGVYDRNSLGCASTIYSYVGMQDTRLYVDTKEKDDGLKKV